MRNFIIFFLALGSLLVMQSGRSDNTSKKTKELKTVVALDSLTILALNEKLPVNITVVDNPKGVTPGEIVKYLLDTLGALLTTFILSWLHKKFPTIFRSKEPKDYTFK